VKFKEYKSFMETQTGKRLKVLRCDNGGEYINLVFEKFIQNSGMEMQTTCPLFAGTEQQFGTTKLNSN
jgi:hypothetical protein